MLANILSRYWWTILLRGLLAILFGVLLFVMPGVTLVSLTLLFGAFALVDGVGAIAMAWAGRREHENWWLLLLAGIAGVLVGVLTFFNPALTALALLFYIAIWAIVTGMLTIAAAVRLRKEIQGEFWLGLGGALSVLFGLLIAARPGAGALAILWLIGGYSIMLGVTMVLLALKVRSFVHRVGSAVEARLSPSTR